MSVCADAVLFDMDGLLLDSEPVWSVAEVELAERLGGVWDDDIKAQVVGTRLDVAVPTILRHYGVQPTTEKVAEATAYLLDRMVDLFAMDLPLHAGALELIDALRARGIALGLVSSSFRVLVDAALQLIGPHRFDVTVAGDEVSRGKPHPEPYLIACARLGVAPARSIVVEDAMSGVVSGEAAGCTVVAVPFVAPIPPQSGRHVVSALTDIDVDWLLGLPCS